MRLRHLLPALLLAATAQAEPTHNPQWQRVREFHVNTAPARQWQGPVFANSHTGQGPAAGAWQLLDLTAAPWRLPRDARWADLRGILIITGGATQEYANLGVVFRRPGDAGVACDADHYTGQTVASSFHLAEAPDSPARSLAGSSRANMSSLVPLERGRLEWCWTRSTQGSWPEHASYGVNLSVQAWGR